MNTSYQLLLSGIPLTSTRGALGWSSVTLVRTAKQVVLVDTGSYGDRALLLSHMKEAKVAPDDVDIVFLTHFHFDHILNFDLFKNAQFYLSEQEISYVTEGGYKTACDPYVPAVIYQLLEPQIKSFSGEVELLPGLRTIPLPGHTPGMTGLLLEEEQVLIAGDGIKNGHEFFSQKIPPVFASPKDALLSYGRAKDIAKVIIPGHDNPFRIPIRDKIEYLEYFSLNMSFAGTPGADPQIIRLP